MSACSILTPPDAPPGFVPKSTQEHDAPAGAMHQTLVEAEARRLQALHALQILDTPPEAEFDDLVQLAAAICGCPISIVSLVDAHRQWLKAKLGLEIQETPRDVAFCHYTIQQPGLTLVEDATLDPRFSDNPFVTGEPGLRFYAGMPIESPDGYPVGTLCVLDRTPRTLSQDQRLALRILAGQAKARLELRAEHHALEQALADATAAKTRFEAMEQRFQTFMDSGPFLAYIKGADGRMLYYNQPLARKFNVSLQAFLGKTDEELWPADLAATFRRNDQEVLTTGTLQIRHEETRNPDGSNSVWRSYKFPCTDAAGQSLIGGVSVDVTEELRREADLKRYQAELEAANHRLSELASLDALTGLANRRVFDEQLRLFFREARQTATPLCVLMLDVDRFKSHNDRFGHGHGDDVLRTLAQHLKQQLRAGDLLARYGGEEFILLLPQTDEENASKLAHRLAQSVRDFPWPVAPVTISIGVSTTTPATPDAHRLVTLADEALYEAKCTGRDRVVCYSAVLRRTLQSARESARSLHEGMQ